MRINKKQAIDIIITTIIISTALFTAISVTGESNTKNNTTLFSQQEKDNWTIMIYLDGDNNFCKYAQQELDEIREVQLKGDITIVVLFDERGEDNAHCYLFRGVTEEIPLNRMHRSWKNEVNMGDQHTLQTFVTYVMGYYPAHHYVLELWGHGYGLKGMCSDETSYDRLSLVEIKSALTKASDTIDILILTACYMGEMECIDELRDAAEYIIASEDEIPASGLPHTKVFNYLTKNSSPEEFSSEIIETYHNYYHFTDKSLLSVF